MYGASRPESSAKKAQILQIPKTQIQMSSGINTTAKTLKEGGSKISNKAMELKVKEDPVIQNLASQKSLENSASLALAKAESCLSPNIALQRQFRYLQPQAQLDLNLEQVRQPVLIEDRKEDPL